MALTSSFFVLLKGSSTLFTVLYSLLLSIHKYLLFSFRTTVGSQYQAKFSNSANLLWTHKNHKVGYNITKITAKMVKTSYNQTIKNTAVKSTETLLYLDTVYINAHHFRN